MKEGPGGPGAGSWRPKGAGRAGRGGRAGEGEGLHSSEREMSETSFFFFFLCHFVFPRPIPPPPRARGPHRLPPPHSPGFCLAIVLRAPPCVQVRCVGGAGAEAGDKGEGGFHLAAAGSKLPAPARPTGTGSHFAGEALCLLPWSHAEPVTNAHGAPTPAGRTRKSGEKGKSESARGEKAARRADERAGWAPPRLRPRPPLGMGPGSRWTACRGP